MDRRELSINNILSGASQKTPTSQKDHHQHHFSTIWANIMQMIKTSKKYSFSK